MDPREVGARIAAKRREKGVTQKQLADAVHVTDKAVSKWEQGKNFPELTLIEPLCAALDSTPAELLGFHESSADEALSAGMAIHEAERGQWLKELLSRARITMIIALLLFIGLICLSRIMDEHVLYGYPMSLIGVMSGLSGLLIGYSLWMVRTGSRQLKQASEKQRTRTTDNI